MKEAISNDTGGDQAADSPSSNSSNNPNKDVNDKMIRSLNSRMSMARRSYCGIKGARIKAALTDSPCNAVCDGGADICLLGSAFKISSHSDRMANVSGFDESWLSMT